MMNLQKIQLFSCALIFCTLYSVQLFSQSTPKIYDFTECISILNQARTAAGLQPVIISEKLSKGCQLHAEYLVENNDNPKSSGMNAHSESPELIGYSELGQIAAKRAVIHYVEPEKAIIGWLRTFYHRIPLLQPNLKEIGIGYSKNNVVKVVLIDCISGLQGAIEPEIVFFPADRQTNVPIEMGPEIPHPIGHEGQFGMPITIYFANYQVITELHFTLLDQDNKHIDCYISTPEKPASTFSQWNSVCAIPQKTLRPHSVYHASLKCKVNGRLFEKDWRFTTA